jgi:gliding motility-associated-like protein
LKKLLIILAIQLAHFSMAQNLISNPSFESYSDCPESSDEVHLATDWQKLAYTSDYYNCEYQASQIDSTGQDGSGYMGVSCLRPDWSSDYREYVAQSLTQPLTAGTEYYVEFWVKLEGDKCVGTDAFGALFTQGEPVMVDSWTSLLPYTPQVENPQYRQLDNTWEWKKICGSFIAEGGENFLTLGSFKSDLESTFNLVDTSTCIGGTGVHWSYVLIDNILVTENINQSSSCNVQTSYPVPEFIIDPYAEEGEEVVDNSEEWSECSFQLPNIITPNNDNKNDYFPLEISGNWQFTVMNRWGNLIYFTDQDGADSWNGKDDFGAVLNDGVYFYLIENITNECRQQGTITIIH